MYNGEIPFEKNSQRLLHYPEVRRWLGEEVVWKKNHKFSGKLVLQDKINSGRSAKYLSVKFDGLDYTMFVKDFVEACILYGCSPGGELDGEWCFVKRGTNYGVGIYK
jgi:hypothetical protein